MNADFFSPLFEHNQQMAHIDTFSPEHQSKTKLFSILQYIQRL